MEKGDAKDPGTFIISAGFEVYTCMLHIVIHSHVHGGMDRQELEEVERYHVSVKYCMTLHTVNSVPWRRIW